MTIAVTEKLLEQIRRLSLADPAAFDGVQEWLEEVKVDAQIELEGQTDTNAIVRAQGSVQIAKQILAAFVDARSESMTNRLQAADGNRPALPVM